MNKLKKAGFSLVEVLVSIVVLAVGVIGAAGMQLAAMRTAQQTRFQNFAQQIAVEIADSIRARDRNAAISEHEAPYLRIDYRSDRDMPSARGGLCYADACNKEEFAEFEVREWQQRIKTALPGGRLVVCRDIAPWHGSARSLTWDCDASSANAPLVIKIGWQAKNPDGGLIREASGEFAPSLALTVGL